jgi:hypothetical protein
MTNVNRTRPHVTAAGASRRVRPAPLTARSSALPLAYQGVAEEYIRGISQRRGSAAARTRS